MFFTKNLNVFPHGCVKKGALFSILSIMYAHLAENRRRMHDTYRFKISVILFHPYFRGGMRIIQISCKQSAQLPDNVIFRIKFRLPFAIFGLHYIFKGVYKYRTAKFTVKTMIPMWVHTDGEVTRQSDDLHIRILRSAINITLP